MGSPRHQKQVATAAAFAVMALVAVRAADASVARPKQTAPVAGAVVQFVPAFAWTRVARADKYEFQLSADPGMNSPVADVFTRNSRATLVKTIPNGTYYWRVRAVGIDGSISRWTLPRSFKKNWNARPAVQTPSSGNTLTFPANPVVLRWSAVPGAAQYLVSVATDPFLSSIVFRYANQDDPNGPPNIAATSAAIASPLPTGVYYWGVTPVDAEGNRGAPSPVTTFNWSWPSRTSATVTDLNPSPDVYDPRFSWNPVPGAAEYEVEVNPSVDFAPGSKVCCGGRTIATSLSPTKVFKNDTYHWRVRALDPDGNAGVWNVGPVFRKSFDNVPPSTAPSIKNLHMRDNLADPGVDQDPIAPGYQTEVPIVTWTPVAGASSYEVDVAPYESETCNWSAPRTDHHWRTLIAVPAWTPLGDGWNGIKPYSDPLPVANEPISLVPGTYCARVRARSDRDTVGQDVYGDYTYLDDGTGHGTAFEWTGYPSGPATGCSGYPCAGDYLTPKRTSLSRRTPYFTWNVISGAQSYFVLVSKDANFTSIVDYGFTHVPAYAPRTMTAMRSYTDETTSYYWAVLPSPNVNGSGAMGDPLSANAASFQKRSLPPSLLAPAALQSFSGQPAFRWTAAEGARRYRLQIAVDPSFSSLLDDVATDATSYSSNTTYPPNTVLYWRVRADDENLNGLAWSKTGTFRKTLPAPLPSAANPTVGEMLPVWRWGPVQGASSYDIAVDQPNGNHRYFSGLRTPVASFIKMTGTGIWRWRVRAEFPKESGGSTPGPYSPTQAFTRTIGEPHGAQTDSTHNHLLLRWAPHLRASEYLVQIASSADFSRIVERVSTETTGYAPTLTQYGYRVGGKLYWRVAAVDADGNQGDWTQKQVFRVPPQILLSVLGGAKRGARSTLVARVQTATGEALRRVLVRLTGPGVNAVAKRTSAEGAATFTVRPKKKGNLLFTATKPGFQTAYAVVAVR